VYCLLVEETYGMRAPFAEIQYLDRAIRVPYTPELREHLLQIVSEMRKREGADLRRNHRQPTRCGNCGFRGRCGQELYS
jgi:CRISPR/Cas system-associated exonuclease Cas4 (RecB family)